jgi:lysophospholipase L1-like esterase
VFSGCGSSPIAPPPPALTIVCPAEVRTQASQGQTTVTITYPAPVVSGGKAPVTTSCAPVSGGSFGVGTTTVSCTASDAATQSAACSIPVTVDPAPVPRLSATSFMAFGDSLTEGKVSLVGVQGLTFPPAYTNKLVAMLQSRYSAQTIALTAEGAGGNKAAADVDRFDRALDADKPQVVLLMEGANDLRESGDNAVDPVIHALDAMASHAATRGIQVFLATLPPENPAGSSGGGAGFVPSLNAKIVSLAASRQLVLVDVSAAFGGDLSLIGADGLHPTDAGYQVIAQAFYDRIVSRLELPPTPSYLGRR